MIKVLIDNQFVRYVIASAIALCVDYGSYWVIAATTDLALPTAAAIGYSVGLIVAYFLIAKRVFRGGWLRNKQRLEILLFALSGGLGIFVTYAVVAIYLLLLGEDVHSSKITAVVFSFVIVYFFRKMIVFRKSKKESY